MENVVLTNRKGFLPLVLRDETLKGVDKPWCEDDGKENTASTYTIK